jgi:hypothetical protein
MDREEFIDELREKIPPFIKERIAGWRIKYAEKEAAFSERLASYSKRLDKIQAAHTVYLNEGLPRDVKKKKRRAIRPLLGEAIGWMIGVLIYFKLILPQFGPESTPFIVLPMLAIAIFFLGRSVLKFWKAKRYAESQEFADELTHEWFGKNGIYELESNIEAEKGKWNNFRGSLEKCVHSAECALAGSDEELLNYYNKDKQAKNWYLEKIYEGEW